MVRFISIAIAALAGVYGVPAPAAAADSVSSLQRQIAAVDGRYRPKLESAERRVDEARRAMRKAVIDNQTDLDAALRELDQARVERTARPGELPPGRKLQAKTARHRDGVRIAAVKAGGPGARAGLKAGDILVSFHGQEVWEPVELMGVTATAPRDRTVYFEVLRSGRTKVLKLPPEGVVDRARLAAAEGKVDSLRAAGARIQTDYGQRLSAAEAEAGRVRQAHQRERGPLQDRLAKAAVLEAERKAERERAARERNVRAARSAPAGVGRSLQAKVGTTEGNSGVLIAKVTRGGLADRSGLRRGDVVASIDGVEVYHPRDLIRQMRKLPTDKRVYIEAIRGGSREVFVLPKANGHAEAPPPPPRERRVDSRPEPAPEPKAAEREAFPTRRRAALPEDFRRDSDPAPASVEPETVPVGLEPHIAEWVRRASVDRLDCPMTPDEATALTEYVEPAEHRMPGREKILRQVGCACAVVTVGDGLARMEGCNMSKAVRAYSPQSKEDKALFAWARKLSRRSIASDPRKLQRAEPLVDPVIAAQ